MGMFLGAGVECIVADEARRFIDKDRSKCRLVLGLYALSLAGLELGKVARASYFFIRHLDDLLDGERSVQGENDPVTYALELREQIAQRNFKVIPRIGRLAAYAIPALEQRGHQNDDPASEFLHVIDALLFDYRRRAERRALTESDMKSYYNSIIGPVTNLLLIGIESSLRVEDIPEYPQGIGRLYSLRDMHKDWELGFVNIPRETLGRASLSATSSFEEVQASIVIQGWRCAELDSAGSTLQAIRSELPSDEKLSRWILNGFIKQAIRGAAAVVPA